MAHGRHFHPDEGVYELLDPWREDRLFHGNPSFGADRPIVKRRSPGRTEDVP